MKLSAVKPVELAAAVIALLWCVCVFEMKANYVDDGDQCWLRERIDFESSRLREVETHRWVELVEKMKTVWSTAAVRDGKWPCEGHVTNGL